MPSLVAFYLSFTLLPFIRRSHNGTKQAERAPAKLAQLALNRWPAYMPAVLPAHKDLLWRAVSSSDIKWIQVCLESLFYTGFLESCVEFGLKVDTGVPEIVVLHQSSGELCRVLPDSGHSSLSVCQPYSPGGMWHYCLGRTAAGEYAGQPLETGCASCAKGLLRPPRALVPQIANPLL